MISARSDLAQASDLDQARLCLAAEELRFLLGRGYPRSRCLDLVGDRHCLASQEREILRRGVFSPETSARRRAKLRGLADLAGRPVGLDGHNLLITLESALAGRILVRADDGVIRDIARAARNYKMTELTAKAIQFLVAALLEQRAAEADFFLDRPVSFSGLLARLIEEELARCQLKGLAQVSDVPERELKFFKGLVASSDSELIEACAEPIDLAGLVIDQCCPKARIIDLVG